MTNRFRGFDLIRVREDLQTDVPNIVQEAVTKTISKRKKMQKGAMAV